MDNQQNLLNDLALFFKKRITIQFEKGWSFFVEKLAMFLKTIDIFAGKKHVNINGTVFKRC